MSRALGEFELIARLTRHLKMSRRTILGPGDDCAIIAPGRGRLLVKIDSIVEGVHFKLNWAPARIFGERALAVNLSDIASMGGTPTACVVNLGIPPGLDGRVFDELSKGLRAAACAARVDVVGGNITRAKELTLTVALLGEIGAAALRRDRARPGDEIYVTGTVGDAAAGWRILDGRLRARGKAAAFLKNRYLRPNARLDAGRALARIHPVPAAIDISDGLLQDLGHILERSGAPGAEIDPDRIPLSPAYREVFGENLELALGGGEDYELLFCLRPKHSEASLSRRLGVPVRRIGRVTRRAGIIFLSGRRSAGLGRRLVHGWDQLLSRL